MTVEVELDDFDDDEIIAYVVRRRLVQRVIDADSGQQNKGRTPPHGHRFSAVQNAYHDLMSRRLCAATDGLRSVIEAALPADLFAAFEAARDGRRDDAICRLDAYLHAPLQKAKA